MTKARQTKDYAEYITIDATRRLLDTLVRLADVAVASQYPNQGDIAQAAGVARAALEVIPEPRIRKEVMGISFDAARRLALLLGSTTCNVSSAANIVLKELEALEVAHV